MKPEVARPVLWRPAGQRAPASDPGYPAGPPAMSRRLAFVAAVEVVAAAVPDAA